MGASPVRCYVAIGSNLDHPRNHVRQAFDDISRLPATTLAGRSCLYRSAPMGPADQPDYINAVAAVDTSLHAIGLLEALQSVEQTHGRVRDGARWGPRTLDLDLLLYGEAIIRTPSLTVPHPGIGDRAFVLRPLHELAPGLVLPDGTRIKERLAACGEADVEPIG